MPARRKTSARTGTALQGIFRARDEWERNERMVWPIPGVERTPGFTLYKPPIKYSYPDGPYGVAMPLPVGTTGEWERIPEPPVWVFKRRLRDKDTVEMYDADPLVLALWKTLPEDERRRSRLFAHCEHCPVRFTKKGAMADATRCEALRDRERMEAVSASVRAAIEPPVLADPETWFEEGVAFVWDDLSHLHRRTLYAWLRPTNRTREWSLEGAPSPEAFTSRIRTARKAVARALALRVFPDEDFSLKTRGRPGFDYVRFWDKYFASEDVA